MSEGFCYPAKPFRLKVRQKGTVRTEYQAVRTAESIPVDFQDILGFLPDFFLCPGIQQLSPAVIKAAHTIAHAEIFSPLRQGQLFHVNSPVNGIPRIVTPKLQLVFDLVPAAEMKDVIGRAFLCRGQ